MLRKIKLLIITVLVLMVTTFQVDVIVMAQDNGEEQEFSTDGSNGTYTFADNGTYTFVINDRAGNSSEYVANVSWIDHTKPAA